MTYEPCNLGFSTADGEDVRLSFSRGDLRLEFRDWQEKAIAVRFEEAIRFSWTDDLDDAIGTDICYLVHDSPWTVTEPKEYGDTVFCHYKLCFNQCGTLDVVCAATSIE